MAQSFEDPRPPSPDPTSEPDAIQVIVNGEPRSLPGGCSVAALLAHLELGERRRAVAVNRDVVPRSHYARHRLAAGDRVEILEAVGAG